MAHFLDVCQCFDILALDTFFLAQSLGESISIVVRLALMVHRSEVVYSEALDSVGCLSVQILETYEPG
jgi:hypothetical protein